MDWEHKFYSIVQETEAKLSKAKDKLTGISGRSSTVATSNTIAYPWLSASYYKPSFTVSGDSSLLTPQEMSLTQILHMKEQIDSQNKTIEKLQKLIRSLDNERDFYKQQITNLKEKVDSLADKMNTTLTLTNSEWKMSSMKRDVMREIEKVKYMLQDYTREASASAYDNDQSKMKDSLTDSLCQIRQELKAMNKKIERLNLESHQSTDSYERTEIMNKKLQSSLQHPRFPPLFSPQSDPSCIQLHKLRMAISSINSKLNSLEKRIEAPFPSSTHSFYHSTQRQPSTLSSSNVDDIQSLSDLSSLSSLSDEEGSELLDDFNYKYRFDTSRKKFKRNTPSKSKRIVEPCYRTKEEVDFELSDLELSDVDTDLESEDLD